MSRDLASNIRREMIAGFIINAALNGVLIWFINRGRDHLPLSGGSGFGLDIAITAFLLMFLVALIVTALQRRNAAKGKLAGHAWNLNKRLHGTLSKLPRSAWLNAVIFGLLGLVIVAPTTLVVLWLFGATEMSLLTYAVFKGLWCGTIAAAMIGPVILVALAADDDRLAQPR